MKVFRGKLLCAKKFPQTTAHLHEKSQARIAGTAKHGNAVSSTAHEPSATSGSRKLQKFLGMGVLGKGLLSRSPFPRDLHFHENSENLPVI